MTTIGEEMIDCFPLALSEGLLTESEALRRRINPDNFRFDKDKHCFLVDGAEVYIHTIPNCGRPNACQHCMYRFKVRMCSATMAGMRTAVAACPSVEMCRAVTKHYKLDDKSIFFQPTENFSLGEGDVITKIQSSAI
jgi:hypothetical protein